VLITIFLQLEVLPIGIFALYSTSASQPSQSRAGQYFKINIIKNYILIKNIIYLLKTMKTLYEFLNGVKDHSWESNEFIASRKRFLAALEMTSCLFFVEGMRRAAFFAPLQFPVSRHFD
jgi:hypothetical protein